MSILSPLSDDNREALQEGQLAYRMFHTGGTVSGVAGVYTFVFGEVPVPGHVIKAFWLASGLPLAKNATDYIVFQPWYALNGTRKDIGRAEGTNTTGILAYRKWRMHKGGDLNFAIPQGALLGFDATVTASGAPGPTLTRPSFWVEAYANG